MSHPSHWLTALVLITRSLSPGRAGLLLDGLAQGPGAAAAGLLEELGRLDAVSRRRRVAALLPPAPDRPALLRRLARLPPELRAVAVGRLSLQAPDVQSAGSRPPIVRWGERLARELRGEGAPPTGVSGE